MSKKVIELIIVFAFATLLGARGLVVILTQHYEGNLKYGGTIVAEGLPAIAHGFGWLGMGLAFLGFAIYRLWPQHKFLAFAWTGIWCAVSGVGWVFGVWS